jgi:hypothetical protein
VRNLLKPKVQLVIASNLLDVDELMGPKDPAAKKAEAKKEPAQDDPKLKDYAFDGRFDLKRVIVSGEDLTNFKAGESKAFWRVEDGVLIGENDAAKSELYSQVAGGANIQEIRFPSNAGIAGECLTGGAPINSESLSRNLTASVSDPW